MNNIENIEKLVKEIINIEKQSMRKRFDSVNGNNEKFSSNRADVEVVNGILTLLGEGKKGNIHEN